MSASTRTLLDETVVGRVGRFDIVRATGLLCDWFPTSTRGTTGRVWLMRAADGRRRGFRTRLEATRYATELEAATGGPR